MMFSLARCSLLIFAVVVNMSLGFITPPPRRTSSCNTFQRSMVHQITQPRDRVVTLFMAEDESTKDSSDVETAEKPVAVVEEEVSRYPVDAPSPLLLSSAMVLAIASVGTYNNFISSTGALLADFRLSQLFSGFHYLHVDV
jgi:hypothetical protein